MGLSTTQFAFMKHFFKTGLQVTLALLFFIGLFLIGCRKDKFNDEFSTPQIDIDNVGYRHFSIEEAKESFERMKSMVVQRGGDTSDIILSRVEPIWEFADTILYKGSIPVIGVPINQCTNNFPRKESFLVFFTGSNGQINSRLVIVEPDENYPFSETYFQYFTGNIIQIDWTNHLTHSVRFENGILAATIQRQDAVSDRNEDWICDWETIYVTFPGSCYVSPVQAWVCRPSGGNSGGNNDPNPVLSNPFGNDPLGWGDQVYNPGGGGGNNNITNFFNVDDFTGFERKVAVEINKFKELYCISNSSPALLNLIKSSCGLSNDPEVLYSELKENLYGGGANMPDCVKTVISDDWFDLNATEENFLLNNPTLFDNLADFIHGEGCSQKAKEFAGFAVSLLMSHSDYKWTRLKEVYGLVKNNPNALVANCDPHYAYWSDLASFVTSGSVLSRIQNSNGTWDVQEIQNASGARVNLDEFSVAVQTLPTINGVQLTAKQLLDHIRKNINNFAPTFTPYDDPYDTNLWNSDNPLTAILQIEMSSVPMLIDGDVITSQYEECCWIFTTLRGPVYASGAHPVSGNRQFGYRVTNNGYEFYTKGADRATTWYHALNDSNIGFEMADALWMGFQNNIVAYVTSNGGQAPSVQTLKNRPNWDSVKDMLKSATPITYIPCE